METNKSSKHYFGYTILAAIVIAFVVALAVIVSKGSKASTTTITNTVNVSSSPFSGTKITVLHVNDLYELTPVNAGKSGGLAKLATIKNSLMSNNPNFLMVLAGDVLSPSALGTAKVGGVTLNGLQMIDVLGSIGLNYSCFGNHEFDLKQPALQLRLSQANFTWLSCNAFQYGNQNFNNTKPYVITNIAGINVGILGAVIDTNLGSGGYATISYSENSFNSASVNFITQINATVQTMKAQSPAPDVIIALTHFDTATDIQIVQNIPGIDIVMGGHDHINDGLYRGGRYVGVFKADSNAQSCYHHDIYVDTSKPLGSRVNIVSAFLPIGESVALDPIIDTRVQYWLGQGFAGFVSQGFIPNASICYVTDKLDGTSPTVRSTDGLLTNLILQSMLYFVGNNSINGTQWSPSLVLLNGGTIRLDDTIGPSYITQYDILRMMPFRDFIAVANITGWILNKAIQTSIQVNKPAGLGSFLLTYPNVQFDTTTGIATFGNLVIANDNSTIYTVVAPDFLYIPPSDQNLGFFGNKAATISTTDMRLSFINYLQQIYPANCPYINQAAC